MIKVSDFIFQHLVDRHCIRHCFLVTGGGAMHLNDSVGHTKGLTYICNHHEQASAIAAEGYYRTCGQLCVTNVTTGPGGTNAITGVLGQYLDSIPGLYISGQIKTSTYKHTYPYLKLRQLGDQEADIVSIVTPITKYAKTVYNPLDIKYELDKAIGKVAGRIGMPPHKRQVVMMMPDPVMFERFTDKSSSTTYWGAVDGILLDFSKVDDQVKALQWYVDLVRSKFNALGASHIELAGLYILSEELVAVPGGWNYQYKRWDRILPRIAAYLNERNEGLYWIPYRKADGTDIWKDLGINQAWLQPNYYWDYNHEMPIRDAFDMMKDNGMGMELEFEYSMVEEVMGMAGIMGPDGSGNYVFSLKDVPSLRERFREYMDGYKTAGFYGKRPIALYSGSNALWQLGTSKNKNDMEMYRELCHFIANSPLKR